MIPVYIEESIHREIRVYSAETGKTMIEILEPICQEFQQSAIRLVTQIKEMRRIAEIERQRQEEESKIVAEHPIEVTGESVEPITQLEIEPSIPQ